MVIHEFECHGWQVEMGHLGNPMRSNKQHQLIGQGFRWQATPYVPFSIVATIPALFFHPVGRSVKRTQRIPQGQVRRETRRIRRRHLRAPHRRLRRIRHPLHQLREIPRPRHRQCTSERHLITTCCTLPCKTYVSAD